MAAFIIDLTGEGVAGGEVFGSLTNSRPWLESALYPISGIFAEILRFPAPTDWTNADDDLKGARYDVCAKLGGRQLDNLVVLIRQPVGRSRTFKELSLRAAVNSIWTNLIVEQIRSVDPTSVSKDGKRRFIARIFAVGTQDDPGVLMLESRGFVDAGTSKAFLKRSAGITTRALIRSVIDRAAKERKALTSPKNDEALSDSDFERIRLALNSEVSRHLDDQKFMGVDAEGLRQAFDALILSFKSVHLNQFLPETDTYDDNTRLREKLEGLLKNHQSVASLKTLWLNNLQTDFDLDVVIDIARFHTSVPEINDEELLNLLAVMLAAISKSVSLDASPSERLEQGSASLQVQYRQQVECHRADDYKVQVCAAIDLAYAKLERVQTELVLWKNDHYKSKAVEQLNAELAVPSAPGSIKTATPELAKTELAEKLSEPATLMGSRKKGGGSYSEQLIRVWCNSGYPSECKLEREGELDKQRQWDSFRNEVAQLAVASEPETLCDDVELSKEREEHLEAVTSFVEYRNKVQFASDSQERLMTLDRSIRLLIHRVLDNSYFVVAAGVIVLAVLTQYIAGLVLFHANPYQDAAPLSILAMFGVVFFLMLIFSRIAARRSRDTLIQEVGNTRSALEMQREQGTVARKKRLGLLHDESGPDRHEGLAMLIKKARTLDRFEIRKTDESFRRGLFDYYASKASAQQDALVHLRKSLSNEECQRVAVSIVPKINDYMSRQLPLSQLPEFHLFPNLLGIKSGNCESVGLDNILAVVPGVTEVFIADQES